MAAITNKRYSDPMSILAPYTHAETVTLQDPTTPSPDTTDTLANPELSFVTRAIMVDVAGAVKVVLAGDELAEAVTLLLLAKTIYPFAIKQILFTGTTATGIHIFQ